MNSDGSNDRLLVRDINGNNNSAPAWSPDGQKLVFHREYDNGPEEPIADSDLYIVDVDNGEVEKVTDDRSAYNTYSCWSADGEKIIFVRRDIDSWNYDIFDIDSEANGRMDSLRNLTSTEDLDEHRPACSPDGNLIAYLAFPSNENGRIEGEKAEIYLMNADGSDPENLTNHPGDDWHPTFSPDGRHIAFTRRDTTVSPFYKLQVMNDNGEEQRRLTDSVEGDELKPDWSR